MAKSKGIKLPDEPIELVGRRVVLRPFQLSDFNALKISHKGRHRRIDQFDEPLAVAQDSYSEYKSRLRRNRWKAKKADHFLFALFDRLSGAFVGQIDLYTFNKELRWANVGYHIQNQFFGKGYAKEACRLCLHAGFNLLGYHRIEASMDPKNVRSQQLAIKLGLKYEGQRRELFPNEPGQKLIVYATNQRHYRKGARS